MTSNQLIRNYDNFNYNSEFIPNYNIFNVNLNNYIGIGTNIPNHHLTVTNNINIKGNLIINDKFFLNKNTSNETNIYDDKFIHILYKNNSNNLKIGKLIYSSPDSKYNDYNFYQKNDNLYINTNDERPNTILTYKSSIYEHNNGTNTLTIELLISHKIYITHLYIYDSSNSIPNNLTDLTINNISTTFNNNIYILNQNIELIPYKNTLTITSSSTTTKYIQLIGNYDFSTGNLWHNTNTNVHTTKNISILSNNSYNNKLYVNGDGLINRNYNSDIINTNIFTNSANLDLDGVLVTKNIVSNKLIIDTPKISFGNNNSTHLATIGNDTFISNNGDLHVQDLTVNSNINLTNLNSAYNEKLSLSNNININNFINLNNLNTQFYHNTVISNKSTYDSYDFTNNTLLVDGNTLINGNLKYNNITYENYNLNGTYINANINSIYISGLAHTGAFTKANHVTTNTFVSPNINLLPSIQKTNIPGTIFYDNSTNLFNTHISNNIIQFNLATSQQPDNSNFVLSQNENILEVKNLNTGLLDVTDLHSTHLDSDATYTKTVKLPLHNNPPDNYNYNDLIGSMKFNTTNENFEIHDGEKWNTLQFENDFNIPLTNSLAPVYSVLPNINLIKNPEQFIPIIPQNFKYNITQTDGSYFNSDNTDTNRITINHMNENKRYNLNRDDTFGIAINNNVIGIGTNFYITSNINIIANETTEGTVTGETSQISQDTNTYQATFIHQNDYEDINSVFVNINMPGILDTELKPTDLVGAYSLRKLFRSYDGPTIRIKRDYIDNTGIGTGTGTEADIYFDMNGLIYHIDATPSTESTNLTSWLNSEKANIIKLYDQSSSANHLSIGVYGPELVDSTLFNKYGIYFNDDQDRKLYKTNFNNFGSGNQTHNIITEYNFIGDHNDNLFAIYGDNFDGTNTSYNKTIGFQPSISNTATNNYYFYNNNDMSLGIGTNTNNSILTLEYNSTNNTKQIYKNAQLISSNVDNPLELDSTNLTLELGNHSKRPENIYKFKGTIYNFLIANKILSNNIISKITSKLNLNLPGILDGFTQPDDYHGAYALQKLFVSYNGPTIRVIRDGDTYETDIYFDKNGKVYYIQHETHTDLVSWLNNKIASIVKWYDQSSNAKHVMSGTDKPVLKLNSNSMTFGDKIGIYFQDDKDRKLTISNFNNSQINRNNIIVGYKSNFDSNTSKYPNLFDIGSTNFSRSGFHITNPSKLISGDIIKTKWYFTIDSEEDYLNLQTSTTPSDGNVFLIYSSYEEDTIGWRYISNNTSKIITSNIYSGANNEDTYLIIYSNTDTQLTIGNSNNNVQGVRDRFHGTLYHLLIKKTWKDAWPSQSPVDVQTDVNIHLDYYNRLSIIRPGKLDNHFTYTYYQGAYALCKLFSSYNGPTIRVKRGNDTYDTDICFDKDGNIYYIEGENNIDINTWLDGQTASIVKWYDQSSSNNDLISGTDKPILYLSGNSTIFGNKYSIYFDSNSSSSSNKKLHKTPLLNFITNSSSQEHTISIGFKSINGSLTSTLLDINNQSKYSLNYTTNKNEWVYNGNGNSIDTSLFEEGIVNLKYVNNNLYVWNNNIYQTTKSLSNFLITSNPTLTIGQDQDGSNKYNGHIYHILITNKVNNNIGNTDTLSGIIYNKLTYFSTNNTPTFNLPGLLDGLVTNRTFVGAYALCKLFDSYNGPTIRVRRSNNTYDTDIYFDKDGNVYYIENETITDLYTWLNINSGPLLTADIIKWYDQSSSANHLIPYADNPKLKLNNTYNFTSYTIDFDNTSGNKYLYNDDFKNFINVSNQDHTIISGYNFNAHGQTNGGNLFSIHNNDTTTIDNNIIGFNAIGEYYFDSDNNDTNNNNTLKINLSTTFDDIITLTYDSNTYTNKTNYKKTIFKNGILHNNIISETYNKLTMTTNSKHTLRLGSRNNSFLFNGSIYNFLVTNSILDENIILNINNRFLNNTTADFNFIKNTNVVNLNNPNNVEPINTYLNNQINKNFSIYNNKFYLNAYHNDTFIRIKNKQQIGLNSFSGYIYYEPLLDSLQILETNNNLILNVNLNIYHYNISLNSNSIKIDFTKKNNNIEVYVDDSVSSYFSGNSKNVSNGIIKIEVKSLIDNIYNIYTFKYT